MNIAENRPSSVALENTDQNPIGSAIKGTPLVHRFDGQTLYELVWSESIFKLAKRLGVSDVGLAKACRKAAIPTPDRGYWAKFAAGTPTLKPPLPSLPPDISNSISLRARSEKLKIDARFDASGMP